MINELFVQRGCSILCGESGIQVRKKIHKIDRQNSHTSAAWVIDNLHHRCHTYPIGFAPTSKVTRRLKTMDGTAKPHKFGRAKKSCPEHDVMPLRASRAVMKYGSRWFELRQRGDLIALV
jgi:hypothetical protein